VKVLYNEKVDLNKRVKRIKLLEDPGTFLEG